MYKKERFNFFQKEQSSHFLSECYKACITRQKFSTVFDEVLQHFGFPAAYSHNLKWRFIESEKVSPKTNEKDLWGSSSPASSLSSIDSTGQKTGHFGLANLEKLNGQGLFHSSGQTVVVRNPPPTEKFFLNVQQEPTQHHHVITGPCFATVTAEKRLDPSSNFLPSSCRV